MAFLQRFDRGLLTIERGAVALMLAVMGIVVFLDVIHRVSTRTGSLLADPWFVGVASAVLAILAWRTRGEARAIGYGLAVGVGVTLAQALFVRALPNGLVWSQTLALALTLWLGCIGASIAAHERRHLALDVGSKLWPPALAPKVAAVGHLVTAAFCLLLLWLAARSVAQHVDLWQATEGAAGTLSGTAIPKWAAALAIPYGMAVLSFRFLLEAALTWTGAVALGGDDTLHQLGIDEEPSA